MLKHIALATFLTLAACAESQTDNPTADLSAAAKASGPTRSGLKSGGEILYGETKTFEYTGTPKYGGFRFYGDVSDNIHYAVTTTDRPGGETLEGWLIDSKYNLITTGTAATFKIAKAGYYDVVFREADGAPTNFSVELTADPIASDCFSYDGGTRWAACPTGQLCTPVDHGDQEYGCQDPSNYQTCASDADCASYEDGSFCDQTIDDNGILSTVSVCTPRG